MSQETRFTLRMTSSQNEITERKSKEKNLSKNQFIVSLIEESDNESESDKTLIKDTISALNNSLVYISGVVRTISERSVGNNEVLDLRLSKLEKDSEETLRGIEKIMKNLENYKKK